jgi:tetratricopeptide (TPR) repeat protein
MQEDMVDKDLVMDIKLAVLRREGEHGSYDTESLQGIISLECSLLHTSDTEMPAQLTRLGNSLMERLERFDNVANVEREVSAFEDAARLTPDDDPAKPGRLGNLGDSYRRRFDRLGDVADLHRAISSLEDAVQRTPDDHRGKPGFLTNLGNAYCARFERLEDVADIEWAIPILEDAVRLAEDDDPPKPLILSNLGTAFLRRFKRFEDKVDVEQAISIFRDAVQLAKDDDLEKARALSNLGTSYLARFEQLKDDADIHQAVSILGEAVQCMSDDHPGKANCLSSLGNSYALRFQRFEDVADIDRAISSLQDAIERMPNDHPYKATPLSNLGASFATRFDHLGEIADLDSAIRQYQKAARSVACAPRTRFDASVQWAAYARQRGSSPLAAYDCAIDLLPRVAWLGLAVPARHEQLAELGDVVRAAAAAAIEQDDYALALEWLEQGRSIVWGQVLNLRSPVDNVRAVDPVLADRLGSISKQLENPTAQVAFEPVGQLSSEKIARKHRSLSLEWEHLVDQIRADLDDAFLRPKKLSQLREAARYGPVVVINVHEGRCDTLVIMADLDDVVHIPLRNFSYRQAEDLQRSLAAALSVPGLRARYSNRDVTRPRLGHDRNPNDTFSPILSQLWEHVVKPVLDGLAFSVRDLYSMHFPH